MMLSFQNLHQFIYYLSPATSALSTFYVRPTSVKKKPEIDVLCSESFLNTLGTLKQSENAKVFKNLQNVKFGPKFEDIQWIFSKDINFRFISEKSVSKTDLYISLDWTNVKDIYQSSVLNNLARNKSSRTQLKKIFADLETLIARSKRNESFISKKSFDENKQSSFCASYYKPMLLNSRSLLSNRLVNTMNFYSNLDAFNIQVRGFKTRRSTKIGKERVHKNFFSRLGNLVNEQNYGFQIGSVKNLKEKVYDYPKMSEMTNNKALTPEEKLKMKVSFAEGYMAACKDREIPQTFASRIFKVLWMSVCFTVGLLFVLILVSLFFTSEGKRSLFNVKFGRVEEIDPEDIDVTFSDVKGVQEVKEELLEIVEFLKDPAKFSSLGGKLPKGVLLVGPPGTGKTLLARAVAGEAKVPFFHASGSEFDEIFVGEGARRVRNLFQAAKAKAPSIIFIDEIDCVGAKRKSTMLHPYANQTINQLLSEMDGFSKNEGVIVIGATNRKGDLDPALLRPGRFDVEVLVPLPDLEGRKEILELYMSKILCKDIDILRMARATSGCTGADLEAMINHAAIRAATEGAPYVTMEYLENAKDKIMIGPERKSAIKGEEALMTAYHEGGHAIVAYFTEGADIVDKVTIVARGETLGHTSCVPESDRQTRTKAKCMADMDVILGGRAAEELIFGPDKITVNASSDLEKATSLASNMVKSFGMSEKLGVRTLKNSEGEIVTVNQFGQIITDQVDMEVKRLVQESYERSKNVLKKHAKEHKLLAEALVKYKTLNPEDVRAILGDNSSVKSSSSSTMLN